MTLAEARKLQADVRRYGTHCTVPLGYGPDGYWCQIVDGKEPNGRGTRFCNRTEWRKWQAGALWRRRRQRREWEESQRRELARLMRPRSPIEMMIDKATGYQP